MSLQENAAEAGKMPALPSLADCNFRKFARREISSEFSIDGSPSESIVIF